MSKKPLTHWQSIIVHRLCPDAFFESVTEIDPGEFTRAGIRGVVLDFDNTIVPWHGRELAPEVRDWIARLLACHLRISILSNAGRPGRVQRVAEEVGVQYLGRALKPFGIAFRRALRQLDLPAEHVAIIGDQVFTDVLGGKRAGLLTILVRPIVDRDFVMTRFSRAAERRVLAWLQANGYLDRRSSLRRRSPG